MKVLLENGSPHRSGCVHTALQYMKGNNMNDFIFTYPTKVFFGVKAAEKNLSKELEKVGTNVMLAYGGGSIKKNGIYDEITGLLNKAGKNIIDFDGIMSNPTYAKVQKGAALAKEKKVDFILAVGGGSVSDCCKIIAAQALYDEDIWDMEFTRHQFPDRALPFGAVVTVSGTGSEQNSGAVITNEGKKLKSALWGASASFAILDPSYTLSVPFRQVISGAFDTLSHAMETYFGKPNDLFISDEISEAVMRNTIRNIRAVMKEQNDIAARSELMWDSALAENGILKIGKVTDFQAHMIEHQLGAYTNCNHGQGLAVIHPVLYRHIYKENVARFVRFATSVWNIPSEEKTQYELALAGIQALSDFIKEIGLPTTLKEMGIHDDSMLRKVADTSILTAGCCKKLTPDEIYEILLECN